MSRVMLVEDDRFVRRSLVALFRDTVEIVAFENLTDARPHVDEHWDGMIIDQRLPDGDGLEFAIGIVEGRSSVPIVLFTGSDAPGLAARAEAHGIVHAHKIDGIPLLKRMVATWAAAHARDSAAPSDPPSSDPPSRP